MLSDGLFLLLLAAITFLIQLIGFPLVLAFFGKKESVPEWWGWGRIVGWLSVALSIWFVSHLGIPLNTTVGFWSIFSFFLLGLYGYAPLKSRQKVRQFLRKHWRQVLVQEGIFLFGFLFLGLVRTFHPQVLDLEKFMNAGYIQGYLRSPTLPTEDMWLSGESINYYSFGQFLGSLILRLWNVPIEVGFNALLGWMMGLILLESFALSQTFLRKFLSHAQSSLSLLLAGLMGAALIVFGGNTHPIWYFVKHFSFEGYWYPDVTRLIENSIHEISAYSFVVSDLHAHFVSVPIVLAMLFVGWQWFESVWEQKTIVFAKAWKQWSIIVPSIVLGVLLGVLGMSNTWDMVVYGTFLSVLTGFTFLRSPKQAIVAVVYGVPVMLAAVVTLSPWLLHFSSIVEGVFLVTQRTPLWQLVALWAGQVTMTIGALVLLNQLFQKPKTPTSSLLYLASLSATGLLFLLLPELIYFKDIYPTYPRANTMFKFAFQAFLMMTLMTAWVFGWLTQAKTFLPKLVQRGLLVCVMLYCLGLLSYPFLAYPSYYDGFRQRSSLNGLTWLYQAAPDDYDAILWLRNQTAGRPVVLEAAGESYSEFGRVSVFSGLPTLIGWRAHEWLWRGGFEIPGQRSEEVKTVYENPQSSQATKVLLKHRVRYIFVGTKEQEAYNIDLVGLQSLGLTVFQQGETFIVERRAD